MQVRKRERNAMASLTAHLNPGLTARAAIARPPLTTVRQPIQEMGARAAEELIDRIQNPGLEARRVILSPQLVLRGTA